MVVASIWLIRKLLLTPLQQLYPKPQHRNSKGMEPEPTIFSGGRQNLFMHPSDEHNATRLSHALPKPPSFLQLRSCLVKQHENCECYALRSRGPPKPRLSRRKASATSSMADMSSEKLAGTTASASACACHTQQKCMHPKS